MGCDGAAFPWNMGSRRSLEEEEWPPLPTTPRHPRYAPGPCPPGAAGGMPLPLMLPLPLPLPPPPHIYGPHGHFPLPFYNTPPPFYGPLPVGGPLPLYGPLPFRGLHQDLAAPHPGHVPGAAAYGPAGPPARPPAAAAASSLPPDPFGVGDELPGAPWAAPRRCLPPHAQPARLASPRPAA